MKIQEGKRRENSLKTLFSFIIIFSFLFVSVFSQKVSAYSNSNSYIWYAGSQNTRYGMTANVWTGQTSSDMWGSNDTYYASSNTYMNRYIHNADYVACGFQFSGGNNSFGVNVLTIGAPNISAVNYQKNFDSNGCYLQGSFHVTNSFIFFGTYGTSTTSSETYFAGMKATVTAATSGKY